MGKYVGTIISVDPEEGFGFVHCPLLTRDSFLGQKNIAENNLEVGDVIAFKIEDNIGKPKVSFNPKVLKDVTKQKKKLQKLRDKAKQRNIESKKNAAMNLMAAPNVMAAHNPPPLPAPPMPPPLPVMTGTF